VTNSELGGQAKCARLVAKGLFLRPLTDLRQSYILECELWRGDTALERRTQMRNLLRGTNFSGAAATLIIAFSWA